MVYRILPLRRVSQPRISPKIDWANPIARGLLTLVWLGDGQPRDLVNPSLQFRKIGGVNSPVPHTTRRGVGYTTVGDYAAGFDTIRGVYGNTRTFNEASIIFVGGNHTVSGSNRTLFGIGDGYNGGFKIANNYGKAMGVFKTSSGSVARETVLMGDAHVVGMTLSMSAMQVYISGKKVGTAAARSGSLVYDNTFGHVQVFGNSESLLSTTTFGQYGAAWSRDLSESEMRSLSDNPWQLFQSDQRTWGVDFSIVGGINTFTVTGSGGSTFGGAATSVRGSTKPTSGGVVFSGQSVRKYGVVLSVGGGYSFSGVAGYSTGGFSSVTITPSGGVVLAGNSPTSQSTSRLSFGGVVFSGTTTVRFNSGASVYLEGAYNDVWAGKLKLKGGVGTLNDMIDENTYWRDLVGGSSKPLNDVKREVLGAGQLNDVEKEYWKSL